jgi:curved DNA-binding protein CbpA
MANTYNLYDILGVESDVTEAQIRTAFRKLTFQHHPDRFYGENRLKAEERFQVITEAFNVLSHPDSREKYDEEFAQGPPGVSGAGMDPKEIARRLAAKGATSMREGQLTEALSELKLALDHDENCSRAHFFMGIALGKISGQEKDGLRHLERAVSLEPGNAVMLSESADLALRIGMRARAQRLAEEALSFDPTNNKASSVLQQAQAEDGSESGENLLGRFRRRG